MLLKEAALSWPLVTGSGGPATVETIISLAPIGTMSFRWESGSRGRRPGQCSEPPAGINQECPAVIARSGGDLIGASPNWLPMAAYHWVWSGIALLRTIYSFSASAIALRLALSLDHAAKSTRRITLGTSRAARTAITASTPTNSMSVKARGRERLKAEGRRPKEGRTSEHRTSNARTSNLRCHGVRKPMEVGRLACWR